MSTGSNPGWDSLAFCGRMNAHISHKIRNILATVSETAGLLDDLVEMAEEQDGAGNCGRLRELSGRIVEQINRGQKVVQRMNQFAHSVDTAWAEVDINDAASLMASLSSNMPYPRAVDYRPADGTITVNTSPFLLEQLLYVLLRFAFDGLTPEQGLTLATRSTDRGGAVEFSGVAGLSGRRLPDEALKLAGALDLDLDLLADQGIIRVELDHNLAD
ncbi:MAG: hypothetical protein AB7D07_12590 [Desulfovibrionaceae bacterium]